MGPGNFLCGCSPTRDRPYRMELLPGGGGALTTEIKDSEGFLVCPQHGRRMYGWQTPTKRVGHFEGHDVSNMSRNKKPLKLSDPIPDTRDMRDPETLGLGSKKGRREPYAVVSQVD